MITDKKTRNKWWVSYQLQPNAKVAQVICVTAIGFEGLGALLEEPRELFSEKVRRERLPHPPDPSTPTTDTHIIHTNSDDRILMEKNKDGFSFLIRKNRDGFVWILLTWAMEEEGLCLCRSWCLISVKRRDRCEEKWHCWTWVWLREGERELVENECGWVVVAKTET